MVGLYNGEMSSEAQRVPSPANWPKVMLFGDSLTQRGYGADGCWVALLSNHLIRKCDVLARGFSGYTTRSCLKILPEILNKELAKDLVLFCIFLGANDSNDGELNPKQHVPLEEFRKNMFAIIAYVESVGVKRERIVIIGPPAVEEKAWDKYSREVHNNISGKTQGMARQYSEATKAVAALVDIEFIDVFSEMLKFEDWPKFLVDGLHFSTLGSQLVFNLIQPAVDKRTSDLPFLFPDWKNID